MDFRVRGREFEWEEWRKKKKKREGNGALGLGGSPLGFATGNEGLSPHLLPLIGLAELAKPPYPNKKIIFFLFLPIFRNWVKRPPNPIPPTPLASE
jgi:hypothetical protein